MAIKLELVSEDKNLTDAESLARVLRWLATTPRRWLLIYDNAERSNGLKGYRPLAGQGAIILTSRSYFNFFGDENRQGETVDLLRDHEREELFLTLLGPKWEAEHLGENQMLSAIEHAATKTLLNETGGLPITIERATRLIKDEDINPEQTVRRFMESFNHHFENLPRRAQTERDPIVKALDTVYAISFSTLSPNARTLLQCLSLIAPDRVLTELFMPEDQSLIPECLEFCRSAPKSDQKGQTVHKQTAELKEAFKELAQKGLVAIYDRAVSMHRTIQEAVLFGNPTELQDAFQATTAMLYDAFPQQVEGKPLQDQWFRCREWILHVLALVSKYKRYSADSARDDVPLKGKDPAILFAELLANCSW
jgi:hypothetical protein